MRDPLSLYTPIADELPSIYRIDGASWAQVRAFVALVDACCREHIERLIELPALLSPAAPAVRPPGAEVDDAATPGRRDRALDEAAAWLACAFPATPEWSAALADDARTASAALRRKADVLRSAPALWRERGTPTGFLRALCRWFGIDETDADQCPILIEHAAWLDGDARVGAAALQATLLLPQLAQFHRYERVMRLDAWIAEQAPAHLALRRIFVERGFWPTLRDRALPAARSLDEVFTAVRAHMPAEAALHLAEEGAEDEPPRPDDLDLGRFPGHAGRDQAEEDQP